MLSEKTTSTSHDALHVFHEEHSGAYSIDLLISEIVMFGTRVLVALGLYLACSTRCAHSFAPPSAIVASTYHHNQHQPAISTASASLASTPANDAETEPEPIQLSDVVSSVAVAGATGRTGSLVVQELLNRGVSVVALVRNLDKAEETLPTSSANLKVIKCDLGNEGDIKQAVASTDAAIWCATGFSDGPSSIIDRIKSIFGVALAPKKSIDAVGIVALAEAFASSSSVNGSGSGSKLPKVIMCSSAGVTRPSWDDEKKELFVGAADIPIVRLNPFNILNIKAESEEKLRQSGTPYCIYRPSGLNDQHPAGCRPVFSQGDVAVGRINRKDVAAILVDCLATEEATGKTFEAFSLVGYPPAKTIGPSLARMRLDAEGLPSNEVLMATYSAMQQLLPGETQQPEKLAMGQTYEQLDSGKEGRLGKRGEEDAVGAAPKPTSK